MAHLPEPVDELDAALSVSDPVVRMPKRLVAMPEPPAIARRVVVGVALLACLIGGGLGAVGVGIVYATRMPGGTAAGPRRVRPRAARTVSTDAGVIPLALFGPDGGAVATSVGPPEAPSPYVTTQQRLGRGRTLPAVLRALGLSRDLSSRIIRALHGLVNMRALQPADVVAVLRDPAQGNDVHRVEYRRSPTQVWAVDVATDGACTGQHIDVVQSTARVAAGFRVEGSLQTALRDARLQPDIVERLQEVFPLLDLGRELRAGDTVRLIVQEERLNGSFFRYGRVEALDYRGAMGRRRAFFQALGPHVGDFFDAQGTSRERGPLRGMLAAAHVTSPFNLHRMHPVLHRPMPHLGCDFRAPMGEPVYAAAEGTVLSVGNGGPAGNLVRLTHPRLGLETGYAHLSRFAPGIRPGMSVRQRQLLGYAGTTGRSTGPHLHFSVKRGGQFVDPLQFYGGRRAVPAAVRAEFDQRVSQLAAELDAVHIAGDVNTMLADPPDEPAPAPVLVEDPAGEAEPADEAAPAE